MNDRPRIEKLRRDHLVDLFDCGQEALNRFLVRYAFQNQQAESSQTYVALVGDEDRKSTRLNSIHVKISYAVFCLKKKKLHSFGPSYPTRSAACRGFVLSCTLLLL